MTPSSSMRLLDCDRLFLQEGLPNWELLRTHFEAQGQVTKAAALALIAHCTHCFQHEPNLLEVWGPVTVVGDLHGQFFDLLKLFDLTGGVAATKYLFLGNYVDRGSFAVELVLFLYCLKQAFPSRVFLLRGSHESREMTSFFNFRSECLAKFDLEVYEAFTDSFDTLPLACVVNRRFFAVHSGISPFLKTLNDVQTVSRFVEIPQNGLVCDLLWADPAQTEAGWLPTHFAPNETRGCSVVFGRQAVNAFLTRTSLVGVIRGHAVSRDGFTLHHWNGQFELPCVISVFSAPNYCDIYQNKGACLVIKEKNVDIRQFRQTPHPYVLPMFLDGITWSLSFVVESVLLLAHGIMKGTRTVAVNGSDNETTETSRLNKLARTVDKRRTQLQTGREYIELVISLRGPCPDNRVPVELLREWSTSTQTSETAFKLARHWDHVNDKRPEDFVF